MSECAQDGSQHQLPEGVSLTAVVIARARARESRRPDRLFHDPLSSAFTSAAAPASSLCDSGEAQDMGSDYFVLRTRFFDDYVLDACGTGCRQVVILAAGLDARAFRLAWPVGVRVYEVDFPSLLSFKEGVIAAVSAIPTCERVIVPTDLCDDWYAALLSVGFHLEQPTCWLAEGLLMYLTPEHNNGLLARIGPLSAPGSRLALEHINQQYRDLPQMRPAHGWLESIGAPWRSHLDDPCGWLGGHGWQAEVLHPAELARRHGRPIPELVHPAVIGAGRAWLVSAVR